jgi:uncharacterized phage protein (predicted DNA packaging)
MANVVITQLGPLFTLEEVKAHLRVDHSDDDAAIQLYMDAAVSAVLQYCNIALVPQGAEAAFKAAALLTVGDLYANRESGGVGVGSYDARMPFTVRALIDPYRWLRV